MLRFTLTIVLLASTPVAAQYRSRAEEIQARRTQHQARLWPERQSPLVDQVNGLVERGLYEGARSGAGANGPQIVLGGMRSGQGMSVGLGYRKSDLWRERLDFRGTARVTPQLAYLFDAEIGFKSLETERFFFDFYTKFESSPQMDFYGPGPDSNPEDRTSYLYEDFAADFRAGYTLGRYFSFGGTFGGLTIHTGTGKRSGVPSTDEVFDPEDVPGLGVDTSFSRVGGFVEFDWRDLDTGPRSGGFYQAKIRYYGDDDLDTFNFSQLVLDLQQYFRTSIATASSR